MNASGRPASDPARISLLVLDVDGVLTDGSLLYDASGGESKRFHVRDGFAMKAWMRAGGEIAVITGRGGGALRHRLDELGVRHLVERSSDKGGDFERLLAELDLDASRAAMLADDLPDLPILLRCGYPMAVGDAVEEVRATCAWHGTVAGGHGAVREAIEHLMRSADRWDAVVDSHRGVTE